MSSTEAATPLSRVFALVRLLRFPHWIKNGFVLVPLAMTPSALNLSNILLVLGGALAFSLVASAIYVLNDIVDRKADRAHPTKCHRPLASGAVPVAMAASVGLVSAVAGVSLGQWLGAPFVWTLLIYLAINLGYNFGLKHVAVLDVMLIAIGFVLRTEAGAQVVGLQASAWIIICTGLLTLFLALAKRRDDLSKELDGTHRKALDGYTLPFLDVAITVVLGALLVAYLIYTTDIEAMRRLGSEHLYYTAPFVVFGLFRYLQLTMVWQRSGSPTRVALTDRPLQMAIAGWAATFAALIYLS